MKPEHPLNPVGLLPRLVVAALVWTAQFDSPLPVWVLGFLLGAAVLLLPLRLWPVTRTTAAVAWAVTCLAVVAAGWTSPDVDRVATTVLLGLTALAVGVRCGGEAVVGATTRQRRDEAARRARTARTPGTGWTGGTRAAGPVAAALAPVPAALLFQAACYAIPSERRAELPRWAEEWVDLAPPAALAGALLTALVAGALQGAGRIDRHVAPLLPPVPKPLRPVWSRTVREPDDRSAGDLAARLTGVCLQVAERTLDVLLRAAAFTAGVLLAFGHVTLVAVRAVAEWLWRQSVLLARRTVLSLVRAGATFRDAVPVAVGSTGTSCRTVLLPVAGLAAAGVSLAALGALAPDYLAHGGLSLLWRLLAAVAGGLLGLTAAWIALAGQPLRASADSARHNAETALPHALLTSALTGWAVSLPTWFGVGSVTPGWLTWALTAWPVALVAAHVYRRTGGRARH